jgi:hypothetical protein
MIYHGNESQNHKGSIVKWKRLQKPEKNLNNHDNKVIEIVEDILLEPVVGQILVTLEHGLLVLSHGEYPLVEVFEANLWDETCEKKLKEIEEKFYENSN